MWLIVLADLVDDRLVFVGEPPSCRYPRCDIPAYGAAFAGNLVALVDVGLVVFVVVELQRFSRHVRLQGIVGVG